MTEMSGDCRWRATARESGSVAYHLGRQKEETKAALPKEKPVSYTHLTLPTIE